MRNLEWNAKKSSHSFFLRLHLQSLSLMKYVNVLLFIFNVSHYDIQSSLFHFSFEWLFSFLWRGSLSAGMNSVCTASLRAPTAKTHLDDSYLPKKDARKLLSKAVNEGSRPFRVCDGVGKPAGKGSSHRKVNISLVAHLHHTQSRSVARLHHTQSCSWALTEAMPGTRIFLIRS